MASVDSYVIAEAEELVLQLKSHTGSPDTQAKILRQVDKLRCLIQTGPDALIWHGYPFQILPALNTLMDFGVFDAVPYQGVISKRDLAAAVKLDPNILSRFLSLLLTQAIFKESVSGFYEHTAASRIFRSDHAAPFYRSLTMQFPRWWKVSDYLQTHTAEEAKDPKKAPFSWAQGMEGMTYYEALEADPAVAEVWHKAMTMIETMQPVLGMFPFTSMKGAVEAEPGRAFVVDVGGGRGNALRSILKECGGNYGAKMILQDMHEVLEGKDPVKIEGVENMPHSFYNEQPVKNAHIYFIRNCLHNHYDEGSLTILRHIVDAMGPTSRLLIGEMILPTTAGPGSDPFPFVMDLCMFMESGLERNRKHWEELLEEVGLKIEKIWTLPDNPVQGTIEARLKH